MICQHCRRSFRSNDGVTCINCSTRYNTKRVINLEKDFPESGDVGHQWRCALCQALADDVHTDFSKENLLKVISTLCEKFELVNKIQLPKLNGELAHIKYMSDFIAKQNEDILRKIHEMEKRNNKERKSAIGYRQRNLKLSNRTHRQSKPFENIDHNPMVSSEKMRYRTRRKSYSYLLNRMLHVINRKLNRARMSPRKRYR